MYPNKPGLDFDLPKTPTQDPRICFSPYDHDVEKTPVFDSALREKGFGSLRDEADCVVVAIGNIKYPSRRNDT